MPRRIQIIWWFTLYTTIVWAVEGLYCKRPIQCLASSEILTPPPPHRPASVYHRAFGAGGGHTRLVERGWGVNSSEDARHCSVLYICKYFVVWATRGTKSVDIHFQTRKSCWVGDPSFFLVSGALTQPSQPWDDLACGQPSLCAVICTCCQFLEITNRFYTHGRLFTRFFSDRFTAFVHKFNVM